MLFAQDGSARSSGDGQDARRFTPIKWKGFSKGELAEHYKKHVIEQGEFGDITQSEYLRRAKEFGSNTDSTGIIDVTEGNFLIRYDPNTRETFVGHIKDREIRTYYIADNRSIDPLADAIQFARDLVR